MPIEVFKYNIKTMKPVIIQNFSYVYKKKRQFQTKNINSINYLKLKLSIENVQIRTVWKTLIHSVKSKLKSIALFRTPKMRHLTSE